VQLSQPRRDSELWVQVLSDLDQGLTAETITDQAKERGEKIGHGPKEGSTQRKIGRQDVGFNLTPITTSRN
jgi:hypothetical protein